jgi:hypothetical protein
MPLLPYDLKNARIARLRDARRRLQLCPLQQVNDTRRTKCGRARKGYRTMNI